MTDENNSLEPDDGSDDFENWLFSIIPVGMAFTFYIVFILYAQLENENLFIAFGAGAAAIGLESYWVVKGLRNKNYSTVIMGVAGIVITGGLIFLYLSL